MTASISESLERIRETAETLNKHADWIDAYGEPGCRGGLASAGTPSALPIAALAFSSVSAGVEFTSSLPMISHHSRTMFRSAFSSSSRSSS